MIWVSILNHNRFKENHRKLKQKMACNVAAETSGNEIIIFEEKNSLKCESCTFIHAISRKALNKCTMKTNFI